jgi:pimeloyl-ACP methyl ester carboxylesterase
MRLPLHRSKGRDMAIQGGAGGWAFVNTVGLSSKPSYLAYLNASVLAGECDDVRYRSVAVGDGTRRALYEVGWRNGEKVVLLPPYGMTFLLVARLGRLLAKRFHVLIWESHGCPDYSTPICDTDLELVGESGHFSEVIKQAGFEEFHFVGWCQAAQFAVHATANEYVRPRTMSFIAPAGLGYSLVKSEFDRCALPIYLDIERNGVSRAEELRTILNKHKDKPATEAIAAEKLTMIHLSDPQVTYTFSRYMRAYEDNKSAVKQLVSRALCSAPTQAIHCRDDTFSHFSESVELSKHHPSLALRLIERGGHLQVYNDPSTLSALVFAFIDASTSRKLIRCGEERRAVAT